MGLTFSDHSASTDVNEEVAVDLSLDVDVYKTKGLGGDSSLCKTQNVVGTEGGRGVVLSTHIQYRRRSYRSTF